MSSLRSPNNCGAIWQGATHRSHSVPPLTSSPIRNARSSSLPPEWRLTSRLSISHMRTLTQDDAPPHDMASTSRHATEERSVIPPEWQLRSHSPPRRTLRTRRAAQLAPYTTELRRYRSALVRNDWQDAVVVSAELARAARLRRQEVGDDAVSTAIYVSDGPKTSEQSYKAPHELQPTAVEEDSDHSVGVRARKRQRVLSDSEESSCSSASPTPELQRDFTMSPEENVKHRVAMAQSQVEEADRQARRDYRRLFRTLKRTMPVKMARLYIEDLKAMDAEQISDVDEGVTVCAKEGEVTLRPGETRRRRVGNSGDRLNELLISEDEGESSSSSSGTSVQIDNPPSPIIFASRNGRNTREGLDSRHAPRSFALSRQSAVIRASAEDGDDLDHLLSRGSVQKKLVRLKRGPTSGDVADLKTMHKTRRKLSHNKRHGGSTNGATRRSAVNTIRASHTNSLSYLRPPRLVAGQKLGPASSQVGDEEILFLQCDSDISGPPDSKQSPDIGSPSSPGGKLPCQRKVMRFSKKEEESGDCLPYRFSGRAGQPIDSKVPRPRDLTISPDERVEVVRQSQFLKRWCNATEFSLDFEIKKPVIGMRCHPASFVGRGNLFRLLCPSDPLRALRQLAERDDDAAFDALLADLKSSDELGDRRRLGSFASRLAAGFEGSCDADGGHLQWNYLSRCIERARSLDREIFYERKQDVIISLQWLRVQSSWLHLKNCIAAAGPDAQDADSHLQQASRELMLTLLAYGLHRTMSVIRKGNEILQTTAAVHDIDDESITTWVSLIHLLVNRPKLGTGDGSMPDGDLVFWAILMDALKQYRQLLGKTKDEYIVAENTWYTVNAIHSLAHFTATTGAASTETALPRPYWPLIKLALSAPLLRDCEEEEFPASFDALQGRDTYIRTILRRILRMLDELEWNPSHFEDILGHLYSLFDSHRLQDLPSEDKHDFCDVITSWTKGGNEKIASVTDDNAFSLFMRILVKCACSIRQSYSHEPRTAVRLIERLLSRFSPMRTLHLTHESTPTALQRSALYNHYNIALVYLALVPHSYDQRLLQLQQYLRIGKAEYKSKIICIRAMMYAAQIVRQDRDALRSVMRWFSSSFHASLRHLKHLKDIRLPDNVSLNRGDEHHLLNQKTVVAACVRAVQHVARGGRTTDDIPAAAGIDLVPVEWFSLGLETSFAVSMPTIALEVLRLLDCLLVQLKPSERMPRTDACNDGNSSQDPYNDLFDEIDLDDPALLDASGYIASHGDEQRRVEHRKGLETLHGKISPILFRLMIFLSQSQYASAFGLVRGCVENSVIPNAICRDLTGILDQSSSAAIGPLLVRVWSRSSCILVQSGLRTWDHYLHGEEDIRLLTEEQARRDVTVRFFTEILNGCAISQTNVGPTKLHPYQHAFVEIWTCVLSALVSREFPAEFNSLLAVVAQQEAQQINRESIFGDEASALGICSAAVMLTEQDWIFRERLARTLISSIVRLTSAREALKILSATLTVLRVTAKAHGVGLKTQHNPSDWPRSTAGDGNPKFAPNQHCRWVTFAAQVISSCRHSAHGYLERGLSDDLRRTDDALAHLSSYKQYCTVQS